VLFTELGSTLSTLRTLRSGLLVLPLAQLVPVEVEAAKASMIARFVGAGGAVGSQSGAISIFIFAEFSFACHSCHRKKYNVSGFLIFLTF
jgi:hypothetical protein